jgi:serine/threonine protein phosphatase PrpC
MHLKLTAADRTDVGKQRETNEDYAYKRIESSDEGDNGLFMVADGMGGYEAGEVASKLAVETISKCLDSFFKPIHEQPTIQLKADDVARNQQQQEKPPQHKTLKLPETTHTPSIEAQFRNAIKEANSQILQYGRNHPESRGLGSTITAALILRDQAYIANVGDSRTYLLRNNQLKPLTKDHSLVALLVESKQIAPDAVYTHPQRNVIVRSLGAKHQNVEADIFNITIEHDDIFLLCSDGLWEMVRPQQIQDVLSENIAPQKICDKLIGLANQNGGEDNITAVVVHVSTN